MKELFAFLVNSNFQICFAKQQKLGTIVNKFDLSFRVKDVHSHYQTAITFANNASREVRDMITELPKGKENLNQLVVDYPSFLGLKVISSAQQQQLQQQSSLSSSPSLPSTPTPTSSSSSASTTAVNSSTFPSLSSSLNTSSSLSSSANELLSSRSQSTSSEVAGSSNTAGIHVHYALAKTKELWPLHSLVVSSSSNRAQRRESDSKERLMKVEQYLSSGISPSLVLNTPDSQGNTPLHLAVLENDIEMIKLLIHHGADVNATDAQSNTPLHLAIKQGYLDLVPYFLRLNVQQNSRTEEEGKQELPVNVVAKNHFDKTPWDYLALKGSSRNTIITIITIILTFASFQFRRNNQ